MNIIKVIINKTTYKCTRNSSILLNYYMQYSKTK